MIKLESYACGKWQAGEGGDVMLNALTGEPVAQLSSKGVDFAAMLAYGRKVGGPALRQLTFHERAMKLKALGQYLSERKDGYYAISAKTGASKIDSMIDIDGGFGTLVQLTPARAGANCRMPASLSMAPPK